MDADVIVVGAGLAGLVTTYELARAGRSVLLLDAEPPQAIGGQAFWSLGGLFLVDSPEQRRLRIKDSVELALADWMGSAGFDRPEDHWPRAWAQAYVQFAAGELRGWLVELGIKLFPVVQWAERGGGTATGYGNSVPRFHLVWGTGPGVVEPFSDAVLASSRVRIRSRHRVTAIESEGGGVRVGGELLRASDARRGTPSDREPTGEFRFRAQAVVVASGGIGGNLDLVRQSWPREHGDPPAELIVGVPDFVDGSMLGVTERAGGRVINRDRMWHYPEGIVNHSPLWTGHGIRILPGPSSLWLDATGRRLPAPLFPGFDSLGAVRHIAGTGYSWSWFVTDLATAATEFGLSGSEQNADFTGRDLRLLAGRLRPGPTPELQAFLDRGIDFLTASSVAELVVKMNQLAGPGAPELHSDDVRELIEARDRQVGSGLGKDAQIVATAAARRYLGDRLMRVVTPHPFLDDSRPGAGIAGRQGPLVAVRLHLMTRKTLGGLETDLDGRVLSPGGNPVPGVYAVGEAAGFGGGGMHGYRALEGTFLGGCLFTGRTVGRALATTLA